MKKTDIIATVAENTGLTKVNSAKAVNEVFKVISDAIGAGDKVIVTGFGSWAPKARDARMGRNPKTNEQIEIPAHTAVTFKAGKGLKDCVNP